jgi:hypothetical protein
MSQDKAQVREQFKKAVFKRDKNRCVICEKKAVDAHHIIDRSLWPDGGYHLDNGASLCDDHHHDSENGIITCDQLRRMAGITRVLLPPGFDATKTYDKWGKEVVGAQSFRVLPLHLETIINQMEARYPGVPGTVISRTLTDNGVEWSVGFGGMSQPKKFFTGATITDALFKAEAEHEKNQYRRRKKS